MQSSRKGLSLIVLIITIVVIIILAAAVILTLNRNNPTFNARKATFFSDKAEVQSAVAIYVENYMAKSKGIPPFLQDDTEITIQSGGKRADDPTNDATFHPEPKNILYWEDIGMKKGKPGSMKEPVTVNSSTGQVTAQSV